MRATWISLLAVPLLFGAAELKPGAPSARWSIKTSLPAGTDPAKTSKTIALGDMLTLTPAAEHRTPEFQDKRYPRAAGAKAGEGDIVRTTGWVRLVAGEGDGDFHLQITDTLDTFDNSLVVEVPKDDPKFVADAPDVITAAKGVREFVIAKLLNGVDPTGKTMVIGKAFVEVQGQLFFDSEHQAAMAGGVFRGKSIHGKQLPSKTSWEIHPITSIGFAVRPQ